MSFAEALTFTKSTFHVAKTGQLESSTSHEDSWKERGRRQPVAASPDNVVLQKCHGSIVTKASLILILPATPASFKKLGMDQTPTALFDSFEQDFRHIIRSISEKLESSGKNLFGGSFLTFFQLIFLIYEVEQRKAALRKVELELDEADDVVRIIIIEWLLLLTAPNRFLSWR